MQRTIEASAAARVSGSCIGALLAEPGRWVAGSAADDTGRHPTRISFNPPGATRVQQEVAVHIGPAVHQGDGVTWPFGWEPAAHPVLLPAFEGRLSFRVRPGGDGVLQAVGSYRPPLGVVGFIVDGAVGHRVAEMSLASFVRAAARRIEATAAAQQRLAGAGAAVLPAENWLG